MYTILRTQQIQTINKFICLLQKCYEQKQYKNGLKFAKQILSNPKFAEHGGKSVWLYFMF